MSQSLDRMNRNLAWILYMADLEPLPQNPVSSRLVARDIAEMMKQPYPNTRLVPFHNSLHFFCLLLNTGTRVVHVHMMLPHTDLKERPLWWITGHRDADEGRCANVLMDPRQGSQAYTLKTFAMHLLSMFDGEFELKGGLDGEQDQWVPSEWDLDFGDWECDSCGWYPGVHTSFVDHGVDRNSRSKTTVTGGPAVSKNLILDIPVELLTRVLDFLGVEDILRLGQASEEVRDIIEKNAIIRDRELRCFVTKEHFTDSSLGIGVCLPPMELQDGVSMVSEFDLISSDAFLKLGVRSAAYGCKFSHWLPLPLSEAHWDRVKEDAYGTLHQLSRAVMIEGFTTDALNVLTSFMEDQAMKLFTSEIPWGEPDEIGQLRASEKGIESLFFLFHLLLCVAVDNPEYVEKANKMISDFQADDARLGDMPSPGCLLAALLISDVETDSKFLRKVFYEVVTRLVPWLLAEHPELEHMEYAASPYRLHHTFANDHDRYRGIMFLDLFQRTVRSADFGKPQPRQDGCPVTFADILKAKRDFFFHRHGFPPSAVLATLAAELPRIMAVDSFPGLIQYMGLYSASRVDEYFLAGKLRDTVRECLSRGVCMPWALSPEEGAAQRLAAEEESPLPETEYLRPIPGLSSELDHEFKELLARNRI